MTIEEGSRRFPPASDNRKQSVELDHYQIRTVSQHGEQVPACSCGALLDDVAGHIRFHRRLGHSVEGLTVQSDQGLVLDDPRGMSV